jgi:deoxyribodipyrimidine photo-lyase
LKKKAVNIIWFKRDLRFTDHEPLFMAQQENLPILLVYFFEPSVMAYDDSDIRHWRFVYESLQEMQSKLKSVDAQIYFFHNEVQTVFKELLEIYDVKKVFHIKKLAIKLLSIEILRCSLFLMITLFIGNNLNSMALFGN